MAARANQEDFRELFKGQSAMETSEDLEAKLKDHVNS